jgi:hypothetical protein
VYISWLETGGSFCVCVRVGFSFLCAQWFYINQLPIMMGITYMAYPPCLLFICSTCQQMHGRVCAWKCMEVYGGAWKCMKVRESVWKCMEVHGSVWKAHGSAWYCIEV